jgi:imidazolonepropionase-like amidohydrolase
MLVRGGRIAAVGKGLNAPAGVRILDATGHHITAGLIDEHSHLALSDVNEGTHPVTSEVRMGDVIDPDDVGIWRALGGGVTAMQVLHGSANPIGGQAALLKLRWGGTVEDLRFAGAPAAIKFALGENVKQSNWDDPADRYPRSRMGVETRIRDAFLAAMAYRDTWAEWRKLSSREQANRLAPRRDLQLEALAEILDGQRTIHCHSYVQSEILSLIRLADELGFKVGTFTHILEGYKVAKEIAAHGAGASSFSDWWAYKFEVYDAVPGNACLLAKAGVVTSINSDSGEVIRRLNQEAAKSVLACDMPEPEALEMVTINPALQLGVGDRIGSLEVGKDADFVIWNGHPLSTLSRAEETWIDGRPVFTRERDRALRESAATEREALVQKFLGAKTPEGSAPAATEVGGHPEWHCEDLGSMATYQEIH